MAVARFLQVSDLHLGRPFGWLAPERRGERRADQRRALERVVREAIERGVHAILIPGDLFDAEGADAETMAFTIGAFRVTGCPPVIIAPGNHDPWWDTSPNWSPRLLAVRGHAWPDHVHVFTTAGWSAKSFDALPGVRVWGRCFSSGDISAERPLASAALERVKRAEGVSLDVALFHGSREGSCPPQQKVTAPFSEDEARRSPFAYHAVGHYHGGAGLRLEGGDRRGEGPALAYAGSAIALDATEVGTHGALDVQVEYGPDQSSV